MMTSNPFQYKTVLRDQLIAKLRSQGIGENALTAMAQIPRELYLPTNFHTQAYHDKALPIGENQTISMPSVVARMTDALQLERSHKTLEIGTGSGYQTAILCKLVRRVFTIERINKLSQTAVKRLEQQRISNFVAKIGDGTAGWPEQAPFDRILLTAAGTKVPQPLLDQLAAGGILVAPVGAVGAREQQLVRLKKQADGTFEQKILGTVSFVPLVGEHGVKVRAC